MAKTDEEQLAQLEQKMKALKEKENRIKRRRSEKERKEDTRRKIIAGAWVLAQVENDPNFAQHFIRNLPGFLRADGKTADANMAIMRPWFQAAEQTAAKGQSAQAEPPRTPSVRQAPPEPVSGDGEQ